MVSIDSEQAVIKARTKIVDIATKIISGELDVIAGCRQLVTLRDQVKNSDSLFLPLVGVESETDDFPLGDERDGWAPEALLVKDREKAEYIDRIRDSVMETCKALVTEFAAKSSIIQ